MATIFISALLWTALTITAVSAVMSLAQSSRRDHAGLIHDTAPKALPTLAIGAVFAALLWFSPHLAASAQIDTDATIRPLIAAAITEAWEWASVIVGAAWLCALVTALFTTVIYYRQQRRLRAEA